MQFTLTINQAKAKEWGLNSQQALLFAFVYEVPSWAKAITTDDGVFFALSKDKIVEELPLLTDKPDTAYRMLKALHAAGVIELSSTNQITLVRLTDKGKTWNKKIDGSDKYPEGGRKNIRSRSEENPSQVGEKSEAGSEKSPTNQDTSNQDTNQDTNQGGSDLPEWLPVEQWNYFKDHRKQLKAKMTDRAMKMAIRELGKLREAGNDPAAVLEQSIVNGWKGVFPVKSRATVHHITDGRARPKHHDLTTTTNGLERRADGTYSL